MIMKKIVREQSREMDIKIIVRERKSILLSLSNIFTIYIVFNLAIAGLAFWQGESLKKWLVIVIFLCGWTVPLLLALASDYVLRRLELSRYGCCYRNMFGRRRAFMPCDVAQIKVKHSTQEDGGALYLIGQEGKRLAKIEMNMVNAEQILPFFETYQVPVFWISEKSEAARTSSMGQVPKQLMVKPKRDGAVILGILFVVYGLIMVWIYLKSYQAGESLGYLLVTGAVLLVGMPVLLLYALIKETLSWKNMRLVLTPELCSFTDDRGRTRQFSFAEIKELKTYRKSRSTYLEIILENGECAARLPYSPAMERAEDIGPFVAYYQGKGQDI